MVMPLGVSCHPHHLPQRQYVFQCQSRLRRHQVQQPRRRPRREPQPPPQPPPYRQYTILSPSFQCHTQLRSHQAQKFPP